MFLIIKKLKELAYDSIHELDSELNKLTRVN